MLKLSGEALMGSQEFGIDLNTINAITDQIIYVLVIIMILIHIKELKKKLR